MSQPAFRLRKLIVFSLGSGSQTVHFGLPIESIYKILGQTAIYSGGQAQASLAHLEDTEITIVDLHQQLFGDPLRSSTCVIVVRTAERLGIPIPTPPLLVDVAPNQVRQLPERYRRLDTLGIASHVAQADTELGSLTLFLIDVAELDRLSLEPKLNSAQQLALA